MSRLIATLAAVVAGSALTAAQAPGSSPASTVVVPRGQPVRIAAAAPVSGPVAQFGAAGINGVTLALENHPRVRGFPVAQVVFDRCAGA
jgi:ABC-type branched-subunit amino acid transport system substrate-binding protein